MTEEDPVPPEAPPVTASLGRPAAPWVVGAVGVAAMVAWLARQGQPWVCTADGAFPVWVAEAWSRHTSQHLFDPYSFTHFLHGFLFSGGLFLVSRGRLPLPWLICLGVLGEGVWEAVENSPVVIERYRANTASLEYTGDSILNSLGDLLCCGTGTWVSWNLGARRAVAVFVATEVALLVAIRDSLLLNMLMLIHPIEALKAWQAG